MKKLTLKINDDSFVKINDDSFINLMFNFDAKIYKFLTSYDSLNV